MRRGCKTIILALLFTENIFAQSGLCNSGVPFFAVDLTNQPGGFYISPSISRDKLCCTSSNPDRCIEFQITLDPAAVGINFEIYSGAQPPGALYYQINCGPLVPVGQQICLSGVGPHTLTFCKPGNNKNQYRITSIQGYTNGADVSTVEDCQVGLQVNGLVDNTIVWRDLTGGGYYENFLNCTAGCSNVVLTTGTAFPPYLDFEVCGRIYSNVCQSIMQTICDTLRVNIEPAMDISYSPEPAAFCETDSSRLMTVAILPRKATYSISWMSGPDGSGSVLGNDTFYYAQSPGTYSLVVVDQEFSQCSADTVNIPIAFIPSPSIVTIPTDATICEGESVTLTASGAASYSWSPASSLSCSNCSSTTASPSVSTSYIITGTDSFGCSSNDTSTVLVMQPVYALLNFSICEGASVTVGSSVYTYAGVYTDTLVASSGCDSIVTSNVQVRSNFSVVVDTVICNGSSLIVGTSVYSVSGTYYDTLMASNGCDSIVETHLAIHPVGVCDNPDLNPCPQRIIFVLDESGSISGSGGGGVTNVSPQVRSAASGLISSLAGTGSQVAVVEFNSTARRANIGGLTGYQNVNASFISNFNTYITQDANSTGSANNYDPEDYSCTVPQNCYTNWEDAFEEVQSINSTLGLASLVIFFTDGQPTAYNNAWGSVTVGTGATAVAQALSEATAAANAVQMQGSHIFVIGLPNTTLPESNVQQISGLERFPDMQQSFLKADYTISSSAQLVNSVVGIARMMCQADLRLAMSVNDSTACAGNNVIFAITVTNDGSSNATGIQVKNYLPDGYSYLSDDGGSATSYFGDTITWTIGSLLSGQSATLLISTLVNPAGNFKNVAEVSAADQSDPDSTPNNDDGDQSEDDEDAVSVLVLSCDDSDLCTNDICISGNCNHSYISSSCSISGDNDICQGEMTQFIASGGVAYLWSGPDSFSAMNSTTGPTNQAGTYSVTVTNGNGCTNTCSIDLNVHPLPVCGITGDNVISEGEAASFTASGGATYTWSGPGGLSANTSMISSINEPGNYSVTATNSSGCNSVCSVTLTKLNSTIIYLSDSVCFGENYVMAGSVYTSSGIYHDTLTAINGCDSVIVLNLTMLPQAYGPFSIILCDGDSAVVGNSVYKSPGIYYDTLLSRFGCDSVVVSDVLLLSPANTNLQRTICFGDTLTAGGTSYTTSGIYLDTFTTSDGCDSIVQMNLTVIPLNYNLINTVICSGESIVVGASVYSSSGVYFDTLISASGCDSIIQTSLQVNETMATVIDTAICSGEFISVGTANYSSSGIFYDTMQTSNGCDSIVTLHLQVLPVTYGPFDYTICQGDSVIVGNSVYTNSGTYSDTFTSYTGCDSIIISSISVLSPSQIITNTTICFGESITVGASTYNATGIYLDTFPALSGCDSIVQTNLSVLPTTFTLINTTICQGENFVVGASAYTAAGNYFDTLVSATGCDSIVQTNLQVMPVSLTTIDTAVCNGGIISLGSSNYTTSGTYIDTLQTVNGCDSIVTINLHILPLANGLFNHVICQGDSVIVGSSVYKNTGTYNDTFSSFNGCDSIVISTVQVLNHSYLVNNVTICFGDIITVGNSTYSTSGIYFDSLTSFIGCDSIIQTILVVLPTSFSSIDTSICSGDYFQVGPSSYSTSGIFFDTLISANGCDSVVQSNLQVMPLSLTTIDTSICSGEIFSVGPSNYNTNGTYSDTFAAANGCDSIVTLHLLVLPLAYGPFDYTICQGDSVVVGNSVYKNSGTYHDTFTSSNGCDSIVITSIHVLDQSHILNNVTICFGDSISVGNSTYNSTGIYFDTLTSFIGCDSIIQTNLVVLPTSFSLIDTSICSGDYFQVGPSSYSTSGIFFDTLISANGCDSVVHTLLQVMPLSLTVIDTSICSGEIFSVGPSNYNTNGTYLDTFAAANGCDSIVTLHLQVRPNAIRSFNQVICQGDSVVVGNSVYKNSGTYNDTFTSSYGCDSIVVSSIQVLNHSHIINNATICSGGSITVGNSTYVNTGVYFDTLPALNGCDSIIQTNLLVLPVSQTQIDTSICSGENFEVGMSNYTSSGVYTDTLISGNGCDSIVQVNLQILPIAITVIDTALCFGETFSVGASSYSLTGNYSDTLTAGNGCDSIVTTNLFVRPLLYGPYSITLCEGDSVQVGNSVYKTPGNYIDALASTLGCDSIVQSSVSVIETKRTFIDTTFCEGSALLVGTSVHASSGTYFDTLTSSSGCDSIIESKILILRKSYRTINAEICQGQLFFVGNRAYSTSGVYQNILRAANGCDSIVITNLMVYPKKYSTLNISICMGDSIVIGNSVYRKSGTYLNTFKTFHGCDSIVQLQLQVWPQINGAEDRVICQGSSQQFQITGGIQYDWFPSTYLSCSNCPNPVVSPVDDISYFIRVTDIHQCVGYDTIHVEVSKVGVSVDISDNEICEGYAVSFSESYNSDYPLYNRMWDLGDGFLTTNQNPIHGYFTDGYYNVNLTVTNSQGCSATADTSITVHPSPEIIVNSDTAICYGDSVQLNAFGAESYSWLPTDYLNNSSISNPVSKPVSDIRYNVVGMSANGCINHASVNITVNPLPDLQVSDDAAICPNGSAVLNATGGTQYTWYPTNNLSDANAQLVAAAPQASTTYQVTALNEFGCIAMDSIRVEVYPKTEFRVSPNGEICEGEKIELKAFGGTLFSWSPPYGLSCIQCETTTASPGTTTKYSVEATDTYGCKYNDSVSVHVKEFPTVSTTQDKTICKGETVSLNTVAENAQDIQWHPARFLSNPTILSPVAAPDSSITYTVTVSNDIGCTVSDTVRLNVISKADVSIAGNNTCPGGEVNLDAVVNNASENGYSLQWSPTNLFENPDSISQSLRVSQNTEVMVILSSQTCEADTESFNIELHDLPEVDAGDDKIVYLNEKITLTAASESNINSYAWTPANRLDCAECQSAIWFADGSRTFIVQATDENGCAAKDSVKFQVVGDCRDDVFVPNAFTPNGDEINDLFMVRSQNQIKLNHFKIFDRWGKEVYSSHNIEAGWDGNYDAKEVAAGVYVYHLAAGCRNGQSVFLKGNVTVIR